MLRLRILSAAAGLFAAISANAATITNGSFEEPGTYVGDFQTVAAGDSSTITGWTVFGAGVDLINGHWPASDGQYSLDLNAGGSGGIYQDLAGLVVGAVYTLSFDMAANPDALFPSPREVMASIGGVSELFVFLAAGSSIDDMGWETMQLSFTATQTKTRLTFQSTNGSGYGPALDNVRLDLARENALAAVPLPATAPLLIGAFGAAAALRRRRKG